jgi:hypothetical protein
MDENMIIYIIGAVVLVLFIALMITFFVSPPPQYVTESNSWFNFFNNKNREANDGSSYRGS